MNKVLDDPSGSSAANWRATDQASTEQPGARRPASPRALSGDAVLEGLRGLGPAPGLADNAAPANLLRMAGAVHETIAARMHQRDRAMLVCSAPILRDSLRRFSISDNAVVQGGDVGNLEKFRAVLQNVRSLPERPGLQARPLAVLAGRLGAFPDDRKDDRKLAFDDILATIMGMPAEHRRLMDVPLMMLAGQMGTLELAARPGAFQRLLLAQEPPGSQADVLHLLAGRMEDLPEAAGQRAFTQVLPPTVRLEPGLLEGVAKPLVGQLQVLPEAAQWPAFSDLLQECSSLAPEQRTVMLKALAHEIGALSEPVRLPAVREVLAAAESLAPEPRWTVLKPLGQQVHRLPEAEQSSTWQAVVRSVLAVPPGQLDAALAAMKDQVATLQDVANLQPLPVVPLMPAVLQESLARLQRGEDLPPEPHATMLLMLAQGLANLPPAERQDVFRLALRSIPLLHQDQHGPLLKELAGAIAALPPAARQPEWQATLQAVEQLPPSMEGLVPLDALAARIGKLPMDDQAAAFESVLQAYRTLPELYRWTSAHVLGSGCLALPRAQWPHALDRALNELAQLDEFLRSGPLLQLAFKFCLAEPAANGPIDPRQPDNPRLDVQTQCLDKIMKLMPSRPRRPSAAFLQIVDTLSSQVQAQVAQRPDDAAFLTEGLERFRRLTGCSTAPRASGGWLARLSCGLLR